VALSVHSRRPRRASSKVLRLQRVPTLAPHGEGDSDRQHVRCHAQSEHRRDRHRRGHVRARTGAAATAGGHRARLPDRRAWRCRSDRHRDHQSRSRQAVDRLHRILQRAHEATRIQAREGRRPIPDHQRRVYEEPRYLGGVPAAVRGRGTLSMGLVDVRTRAKTILATSTRTDARITPGGCPGGSQPIAFSPDGRWLAYARNCRLGLYDLARRRPGPSIDDLPRQGPYPPGYAWVGF
jgi:hypothetical protein